MAALESDQIELMARTLRRRLGIDHQSAPDMMTVIVKLKRAGLLQNYRRVPDEEMPEDEASFDPETKILSIREDVFCAMNVQKTRARFTIAHEIGHLALGHKKARNRNVSGRRIEKIAAPIIRDEAQANRFAGAFLAPLHCIENPFEMTDAEIAEHFNIGISAAKIRKPELEKCYRQSYGIRRELPRGVVEFLKNAKRAGHEVKSLDDSDK